MRSRFTERVFEKMHCETSAFQDFCDEPDGAEIIILIRALFAWSNGVNHEQAFLSQTGKVDP
jgi:hypothetical protein